MQLAGVFGVCYHPVPALSLQVLYTYSGVPLEVTDVSGPRGGLVLVVVDLVLRSKVEPSSFLWQEFAPSRGEFVVKSVSADVWVCLSGKNEFLPNLSDWYASSTTCPFR